MAFGRVGSSFGIRSVSCFGGALSGSHPDCRSCGSGNSLYGDISQVPEESGHIRRRSVHKNHGTGFVPEFRYISGVYLCHSTGIPLMSYLGHLASRLSHLGSTPGIRLTVRWVWPNCWLALAQVSQPTHGILPKLLHNLNLEKCSRYLPGYPCAFSKSISHNILRILLYLGSARHSGSRLRNLG